MDQLSRTSHRRELKLNMDFEMDDYVVFDASWAGLLIFTIMSLICSTMVLYLRLRRLTINMIRLFHKLIGKSTICMFLNIQVYVEKFRALKGQSSLILLSSIGLHQLDVARFLHCSNYRTKSEKHESVVIALGITH